MPNKIDPNSCRYSINVINQTIIKTIIIMHFAKLIRYQIGFFILGQSTIIPGNIRFGFILRWIPIFINFCLIVFFFKSFTIFTFIRIIEIKTIYLLYGVAILTTNFSSIIINLILPYAAQKLVESCITLLKHLEQKFGVPFEWRYFVNSFNITLWLSLFAFALGFFGRFIHNVSHLRPGMDAIIVTMNFFDILSIDYIIFHVALYSLILQFLNFNLKQMAELNHLPKKQLQDILSYVTEVHQRLWSISIAIDNRFGWQLLAVLFESFIQIIHTVYSTFWYLDSYGDDSIRRNTIVLRNCIFIGCSISIFIYSAMKLTYSFLAEYKHFLVCRSDL